MDIEAWGVLIAIVVLGIACGIAAFCVHKTEDKVEDKYEKTFSEYGYFVVQGIEYNTSDIKEIQVKYQTRGPSFLQLTMANGDLITVPESEIIYKKEGK
jgi:hypothetical protein